MKDSLLMRVLGAGWRGRERRARLTTAVGGNAVASPVMAEALENRQLFAAVTFPSAPGLEFQTNGQARDEFIGDWYTTANSASTDRAHYVLVQVTQTMLDLGSGTVTITVNDAESTDGPGRLDEVQNAQDPTRFQLLTSDRATVLSSTVVPGGSPNATDVVFSVTTPGTYYVQSVTGALPISGDATPGLNDDDNAYAVTVSQDGGLVGQFQATFQPTTTDDIVLFFIVGPSQDDLFLRNFDLDGATITYRRPGGGVITGTASASGEWNGTSPTLDTGGDLITGLTPADAGIWRVTIGNVLVGNQAIFEPNTGTGQRIVFLDAEPQGGGNFTLGANGTLNAVPGTPVDHPFTITNAFATSDLINLTTSGTSPGFTAELLDANGVPLTDATGDGRVDTGVLQSGETKSLILRVTPSAGATGTDATVVQGVSFLDERIIPGDNISRSITRTTVLAASAPAIETAVVDYGFLRSRDATLTGTLVAGDPGPHRVRVNWGDGQVSFLNLADGDTTFSAQHRYKHGNRRSPVRLVVTNTNSGVTSDPFSASTRSQALVRSVYQDTLGRDPTEQELNRLSKKFDRCRSAESLEKQAAKLRSRLNAGT